MMSSEEESETTSYGLLCESDNKTSVQVQQLLKKQQYSIINNKQQQRIRQRVDAGEPRNSYSSIPNFSSRSAAFMSGGLYGAIFSQQSNNTQQQQQQQTFGSLFGPTGYGPAKMLNDLLHGRQVVKQENVMISPNGSVNNINNSSEQLLTSANNIDGQQQQQLDQSKLNNNNSNNSLSDTNTLINNSVMDTTGASLLLDEATAQATNDLAHHMLRNILQGKKELQLALDQELRKSGTLPSGSERNSPDNNNTILNKNNNLTNNNNNYENKGDNTMNITTNNSNNTGTNNDQSEMMKSEANNKNQKSQNNENDKSNNNSNINKNLDEQSANKENNRDNIPVSTKQEQLDDDDMAIHSVQNSEQSLDSPISTHAVDGKDDIMDIDSDKDEHSSSPVMGNSKPQLDLKRARVENIVSSMRASPALIQSQPQVNGCKKRKLYQPQQHDNSSVIERYAAAAVGLNLGLNFHNFMMNNNIGSGDDEEDEEMEPHRLHQKRIEKNVLKSQLKSMQEQLAEMQQKYMQLCNRMDQTSDTPDIDENSSDIVEDDMNNEVLNKRTSPLTKTPMESPVKEIPPKQNTTPNMLSQVMSKMMSAKMQGHLPPHLPPQFNGQHPFLQHLQQQQQAIHDAAAAAGMQQNPHQNPNLHAAAMYQKLFMEQEARRAKEAAEQQQEMLNQQHAQHTQQHQSNGQQPSSVVSQSQPIQTPTSTSQQSPHNSGPISSTPNGPSHGNPLPKVPSELQERLNLIRNSTAQLPNITGSDLEGLAEILKSEISSSLTNLVDTIVGRFMQQRKFLGKASEQAVAATEQFSKDLMLASQLLDRKSPRTKVQDRSNNSGTNSSNTSGNNSNNNLNVNNQAMIVPNNNQNIVNGPRMNGTVFSPPGMGMGPVHVNGVTHDTNNPMNNINMPTHIRPPPASGMFQPPKPPQGMSSVAAAALYNSMANLNPNNPVNPFCLPESRENTQEQNEALSLVVTPKKKRHKVTDTRITPRTVSRILAQDGIGASTNHIAESNVSQNNTNKTFNSNQPPSSSAPSVQSESLSPRQSYHPPPSSMLPVSLPTSVAIPNPSLHESKVFSPYSPFFNPHGPHGPQPSQLHHMHMSASPPGIGNMMDPRDSPPLPHPPTMLHPAFLAAAHHGNSPDYSHIRAAMDANDRNSDCNSGDMSFDGMQPTISFSKRDLMNHLQSIER